MFLSVRVRNGFNTVSEPIMIAKSYHGLASACTQGSGTFRCDLHLSCFRVVLRLFLASEHCNSQSWPGGSKCVRGCNLQPLHALHQRVIEWSTQSAWKTWLVCKLAALCPLGRSAQCMKDGVDVGRGDDGAGDRGSHGSQPRRQHQDLPRLGHRAHVVFLLLELAA